MYLRRPRAGTAIPSSEVRMRVVAGVDCHKSAHTAVFIDAVGQVIDRITFPTTEKGYERALAVGRRLGCTDWALEGGWLLWVCVQRVRASRRRHRAGGTRHTHQAASGPQ